MNTHPSIKNAHNTEVSHSRYTMFRCILAVAHADGILDDAEIGYFEGFMLRLPFDDEQRAQLEKDIKTPQNVFDLFREINEPGYRAQVLYFARIMAFKDGNLSPSEDDILKKLHIEITGDLDLEQIKRETHAAINKEMFLRDIEISEERDVLYNSHVVPWLWLIDRVLLAMGINLLDD